MISVENMYPRRTPGGELKAYLPRFQSLTDAQMGVANIDEFSCLRSRSELIASDEDGLLR